MALKDWKNQTSLTQKKHGGKQWYNKKDYTQITIGKWDFNPTPKNWAVQINSVEEARKGYPSQRLGITKTQALAYAKAYMRKH